MNTDSISIEKVWEILNTIPDPEIPVITIVELGVVRDVKINGDSIQIQITPTYTGCPATNVFEQDIRSYLMEAGFKSVEISFQYNPAWRC